MMIRTLLTCASSIALVFTAVTATANAGEAAGQTAPAAAQSDAVKYKPEARAALTPESVKNREDAAKLGEAEFASADVNADAFLSSEEFAALQAKMRKPSGPTPASPVAAIELDLFAAIAGEDNQIAKEEMAAARVASFDTADADQNKTLSASERQVFASLLAPPVGSPPKL